MKILNQFNVPRFSDLEQDYARQEVMEYKQFALFLATTQLLVNYTHAREKRRMLKACTVSVWQIMFMHLYCTIENIRLHSIHAFILLTTCPLILPAPAVFSAITPPH